MTSDNDWQSEIERNEAWFRGVCPDVPEEELEGVKLKARVAVQEEWLSARMNDAVPTGMTSRVRERVRRAIVEKRPKRFGMTRRSTRWFGALAAAAAIALFFWMGPRGTPQTESSTDTVAVFSEYQTDAWSESLDELDDEISVLELVWGEETDFQRDEDEYNELQDAIDRLMWDGSSDPDWS
ncbi:MAG: hypothetical protein AABZ47_08785 [Planctomycetota bacterium]